MCSVHVLPHARDYALHSCSDPILDIRSEASRKAREEECFSTFVTAFFPDAQRWNVTEYVIRIAGDPSGVCAITGLEFQGIIDGQLACECNYCQATGEVPGLNRIGPRLGNRAFGL